MIILNSIIFGLYFAALGICSFVNRKSDIKKDTFILIRLFYLQAEFLYVIYGKIQTLFPILRKDQKEQLLEKQFELLNPSISVKEQRYLFQIQKIVIGLVIVFVGSGICLLSSLSIVTTNQLIDNRYIKRDGYQGSSQEIVLNATVGEYEDEYDVTVENKEYSSSELDRMIEEIQTDLEQALCGENVSLEHVTKPLNMISFMEKYPFHITWESNNYDYIDLDGTLKNEAISEPCIIELTAKLAYEEYMYYQTIPVVIYPKEYTKQEALNQQIEELVNLSEHQTRTSDTYELPNEVDGATIVWKEKKVDQTIYILLLAVVACVLSVIGKDRDLNKQVEKRNKELQMDYSQFVSKITLYLGAGMTLRNVFMRLGMDYEKRKSKKRYVYEEVLLTCHELSVGISEVEAYEHFGKRCKVRQYIRLGALLTQNIKKGSNNLIQMLHSESRDAFEERKNIARKYGEEAGTKLLGPMIMMLCVVMIIIMVPAYFSFSM